MENPANILTVRPMEEKDIDPLTKYWMEADPAFLTAMGVDLNKMLTESEWKERFRSLLQGPVETRQSFCVIWEENSSRTASPWNGTVLTRGMEFGVSPFPETRRRMIERGRLFDTPAYRWLPARAEVTVEYWAVVRPAADVPEHWSIN